MGGWLLPLAAGAFWSGILLAGVKGAGSSAAEAILLLGGGLVGLGVVAFSKFWGEHVLLVMLSVVITFGLLGAGWTALRAVGIRASPLVQVRREVRVWGSLGSDPEAGAFGWTADLRADFVAIPTGRQSLLRLHDLVRLEGRGRPPRLETGDLVVADGTVSLLRGSFGASLRRRGYAATFLADSIARRGPPPNPLVRAARATRASLRRSLDRVFSRRDAGLVMGLALGDTSRLDPMIQEEFRATGLSHLTAVSGENLAMFLAPVLGLTMLLRLGRNGRFGVGIGAVGFFVLLTGGEPSVLRAAAMAGLTMLGIFLGRPRSPPAIFGAAVLGLLALDPTLVYSIGFRLSVAATGGMALLATPLADRLRGFPRWFALAAGTTMGAQAGVMPLLLYHFGLVPTVTVPANLLAFPAVAPAMLLGLASGGVALVSGPIAAFVAVFARVPLGYLMGLAHRLARFPLPSITSSQGHLPELLLGLAAVGAAGWWLRSGRRVPRRAALAMVLVLPVLVWTTALRAGPPSELVVRFFDVGQGDAALVTSPGGASVLVDGGPDPNLVAVKLAALGVKRLDAVVATHPHEDHYVGLPAVLARFHAGIVFDSGCDTPDGRSPAYREFLRAVRVEGIPELHPTKGNVLVVGDLRLEVLSPDRCWQGTHSDPNNDSLVLLLTYGEDTVLFANEPEADAQQAMLDAHAALEAEVLNVPHHGASTSIRPFFQAVHARVAVVSVGPNRYGHPVPTTLQWLRDTGTRVFRTDRTGDVVIRFGALGLEVETGRGQRMLFPSS